MAHSLYQEGLPAFTVVGNFARSRCDASRTGGQPSNHLVVRKGYSPKLRHITRTHKINLSGLSEVYHEDSAGLENYKTNDQAADIFAKSLPPQKWGPALRLLGIRADLSNELKGSTEGAAPTRPT